MQDCHDPGPGEADEAPVPRPQDAQHVRVSHPGPAHRAAQARGPGLVPEREVQGQEGQAQLPRDARPRVRGEAARDGQDVWTGEDC